MSSAFIDYIPVTIQPVLDSEGDSNADDAPVDPLHPQCSPSPEISPIILSNSPNHSPLPQQLPDAPANAPVTNHSNALPDAPTTVQTKLEPETSISSHSHSPAPEPDIPLALRHPRHDIRPPTEWWKVRHPILVVLSDSDSSGEEGDADIAEFANAAHDLDPKLLRQALA